MPALGLALGRPFDKPFGDAFQKFLDSCGGLVSMYAEESDRPILQGAAMSFDGATQWAFTDSLPSTLSQFDVSFYVNPSNTATTQTIFDARAAAGDGLGFLLTAAGNIQFKVDAMQAQFAIPFANWTRVRGVWDGSNINLYIDGDLEVTVAYSAASINVSPNVYLAARSFTSQANQLTGTISDLAVSYNGTNERWDLRDNGLSALTGGTALTLVGSPVSVTDNTIPVDPANERGFTDDNGTIYLALADDPSTDVLGNPTQWQGSAYPVRPVERQSNALSFDGATQNVQAAISIPSEGFSVSGWVKPADNSIGTLFFAGNSTAFNQMLLIGVSNLTNEFELRVRSAAYDTIVNGGSFVVGQWYFLEAYFSEDLRTLSVDGVEVINETANFDFSGITVNVVSFGNNADSSPSNYYNGTISNPTINGSRFPLAEGAGSTAYDSRGNGNHGTLVGNPTWVREDGIPSSNLDDGFSLYEHATLDPLRVPYGDDGQPLTITPPTGYTKTSDNPAVTDGHNGAETELDFYNVATDGGTTPAILASGVAITDYTFGDTLTNPMFKRSLSLIAEDRHTLFSGVLSGACLGKANRYFTVNYWIDTDIWDDTEIWED